MGGKARTPAGRTGLRARLARPRGRLAHRVALHAAWRLGRRFGFSVIPDSVYSPLPHVPPPGDAIWEHTFPGLELDEERQLALIEGELAGYVAEFAREVRGERFELWNGFYAAGDAEILYALLRHLKPRRVLEIGSGFSTYVSAAACAANAREGAEAELVAVDPEPRTEIRTGIPGLARVELRDCRELPLERFLELSEGDVLFIDSSHAVKLGSEVNWLFLEVLPRLRPGVYVHVHDVFLPYEYPRHVFEFGGYFNEQYLLQALLLENPGWEVVLGLHALARRHRERMRRAIPSLAEEVPGLPGFEWYPAAFWIRRTAAGA